MIMVAWRGERTEYDLTKSNAAELKRLAKFFAANNETWHLGQVRAAYEQRFMRKVK